MIRNRLYRNGVLKETDFDSALVSDYLDEPEALIWLDMAEASPEDLALLPEEFGLHPLAIEDAGHSHQRPKIDVYSHHLFLVIYAVALVDGALKTCEVDMFVGDRYLVTVRKAPVWAIEPALKRLDARDGDLTNGGAEVVYILLDSIVDEYFPVAEDLGDQIEALEDELLEQDSQPVLQKRLFDLRKNLVGFRRQVLPMREVMNTLLRRDLPFFQENIIPYFQDIYDHVIRVNESAEAMRELLDNAMQMHLSMTSNRLNEIMKRVTSWGALIGLATTIAGIYGMNFRLVPRDQTVFGFWFALGLIVVSCTALYFYFKARDWL